MQHLIRKISRKDRERDAHDYCGALLLVLIFVAAIVVNAQEKAPVSWDAAHSRVLLVVAHPDDESEMAATIYRIAKELSGVVDQVIISDGEGGFRYSALAGRYYGADLSNESVGRVLLPRIRQEESRQAARILGIRYQWFLNERDEHFTIDANEVLQEMWKSDRVEEWLIRHLQKNRYDFVFVLLPSEDTHGEHKAASILALRAVGQLPENERPAVIGVRASPTATDSYQVLSGYAITTTEYPAPEFHFDRDLCFGYKNALSYQIVVDWVIAEHKSQGLFQTTVGKNRFENFWVFAIGGHDAEENTAALFAKITP